MSLNCLRVIFKKIVPLFLVFSLSACATTRPPLTGIVPGRQVETLQSAINISIKAAGRTSGGRAFLVFQRPDRFHMAVLSPFGLTILDVFSDHDRLTCLVPSKQIAYSGLVSELPESSGLNNVALMKWVVAPPPVVPTVKKEITTASGDRFYFDSNGLVERKVSAQGDQVSYHHYQNVDGIAFPESIEIANRYGAVVNIVFDEPQLNLPVENSALTPVLEGISIHPLADFHGL